MKAGNLYIYNIARVKNKKVKTKKAAALPSATAPKQQYMIKIKKIY